MSAVDVGVVIGRFQVPDLTDGHLYLIQRAQQGHRRVLVLVGSPQEFSTHKNPLDYPTRERMIRARFPDVVVQAAPDFPGNNKRWSHHIDITIKTIFPLVTAATLYAGRDSFKPHYVGQWPVIEADSGISYVSGTETRANVGKVVLDSVDFRRGVIYATQNVWSDTRVVPNGDAKVEFRAVNIPLIMPDDRPLDGR